MAWGRGNGEMGDSYVYKVKVGDITINLQREGNEVMVGMGWISQRLSREDIEELRYDLDEVLREMFGDDEV